MIDSTLEESCQHKRNTSEASQTFYNNMPVETIVLSQEGQKALKELMERPAQVNEKLLAALHKFH